MTRRIEKHHRQSLRLRNRDYAKSGEYVITICTTQRECLLGEVVNGEICLNEFGKVVQDCWFDLPKHYPHVVLDEFVIMPNHVHGIIVITNIEMSAHVGARSPRPYTSESDRKRLTLGKIVAYFKYQSTKRINQIRKTPNLPLWQRNYYERILRRNEINNIREYIRSNPGHWASDEENPENIKSTVF